MYFTNMKTDTLHLLEVSRHLILVTVFGEKKRWQKEGRAYFAIQFLFE